MNNRAVADIQKEVSCRVTNSVIKYLESKGYDCDSIIKNLPQPYSKEYLTDPHNWVTYETRETLCRRAAELTNDNAMMFQVGLATPTLNPLGGIETIIKLLTGPRAVYKRLPRYASFFDRVFKFKTTNIGPNKVTVEMSMNAVEYSPSKDSCYYAQGIIAAIPTLWGLPPATIREKKCMCHADLENIQDGVQYEAPTCEYEVQWQSLPSLRRRWRDNLFSWVSPMTNDVKELEESFRQVDQKNAELVARNRQLAAVREIAISIDNVRTVDEALSLAVEQAREIEGVQFVLVQKLDETREYVTTPYYSKIRSQFRYMTNAIKALGFDVERELGKNPTSNKLRFRFSKLKVAQDYTRNPRIMVIPSLAELLDGIWPAALCNAIQKIMGVKKLVIVPIMVEGESWGNMLFFLSKEVPVDILEMIGAHCALAVKNIESIQALGKSEDKFSKAFHSSPNLMAIATLKDGKYIEINDSFITATGYTRDEIIGRTSDEIQTWANETDRAKMLKLLREKGKIHNGEFQFRNKFGEVHTMLFSAEKIKIGNEPCLFSVCSDITERKQMEERIRYHANLIDVLSDAIVSTDLEYKIISWNKGAEKMHGWREEEVIGKSIIDILHPVYVGATMEDIQKSMDKYGYWSGEAIQQRKDGTKLNSLDTLSTRRDAKGNNIGAVSVFKDITERKQMEKALRDSEENFSVAFHASPQGICITRRKDGKVLEINDSYAHMSGYSREEIIGRTSSALNIWTKAGDREKMLKILEEKGEVQNEEFEFRIKSGEIHTRLFSAKPVVFNGEECLITILTDITERKRVEEALKESEERFSKAFHATPDAISISTLGEGIFIEVNDSYIQSTGFTREELIGKNASSLNMWANEEQRKKLSRNIATRIKVHNEEYLFRTKSGELREKLISTEFVTLGGKPCLLVVSTDITELKKVEEALRASEQKFSAAFLSSPNAICIVSVEGQFVEVNDSFSRFTGYTREEIISRNSDEMGFWLSKADAKRMDTELKKTGRIYNKEFASRSKSGEIRIGLFSAETIDIGGKGYAIMVITDITDRRRAQEALKISEENIRSQKELIERILATIPNAVFLLDKDFQVIMANQAVYKIFKVRETKNKYERITKALKATELNLVITNMVSRGEQSARTQLRYVIAGSERILSADIFIMLKDEILLVVNDITDELEKQERLYLTDRLVSVGEMASGVAHELNNPLTSVIGLSSLLLQQDVSDTIKEDVQTIYSEAQRCASIVKNLLTFARKHVSKQEPLQIAKIVADVLKLRAYELKVNNITVETDFPPDFPEVLADNFEIQQVFINLILNAEAAMIEAHGRGTLKITGQVIDNNAIISFTDDGPGISTENMRYIFNPFYTTKEVGKGTGLGLSICYGIITSHGGKIYAKSELGQGATFIIELPVQNETGRLDV